MNEVSPFRYGVQNYINFLETEIKRLNKVIKQLRDDTERSEGRTKCKLDT